MACPYFYPVARFETSPWSVPPRLPLGEGYSGECRAPSSPAQPALELSETHLREICNVGYGRRCCEHFPAQSDADAIRFHVSSDAGKLIKIQYIFEKDCWPGEHGEIDFTAVSGVLRRQAEAFRESYLRRRSQT
jgi:hypothetical protein